MAGLRIGGTENVHCSIVALYVTCKTIESHLTHHMTKEANRDFQSQENKIMAKSWYGGCSPPSGSNKSSIIT